jgi:hypothetical protein
MRLDADVIAWLKKPGKACPERPEERGESNGDTKPAPTESCARRCWRKPVARDTSKKECVPEGRVKVARRFNAGKAPKNLARPVRDA